MNPKYLEAIELASQIIADAMTGDMEEALRYGAGLDRTVQTLTHAIGQDALTLIYATIARHLTHQQQQEGWQIEHHPTVIFKTLFGPVAVDSPYLQKPGESGGLRPMRQVMGVEGNRYSEAVERALVDFGSEKSFERAARQFQEHYGWDVERGTILRRTESVALSSQQYIQERLFSEAPTAEMATSAANSVFVVELDGCDIRTGVFMRAAEAGSPELDPDKLVRQVQWQEVRTGLVRPLDQTTKHYVCRKGSYPQVCDQLFALATEQGVTPQSLVLSLGDGGIGLQEELARHFSNFQYILDLGHLKSHFYDTAEKLGIEPKLQHRWVDGFIDQLWHNDVQGVLQALQALYQNTKNERLRCLINHLKRFEAAVEYGRFQENGWPIGSGEVESAHRYIPQERLKIPGAIWNPDTVNPMLALRVIRANDWWDDFWQWLHDKKYQKMAA